VPQPIQPAPIPTPSTNNAPRILGLTLSTNRAEIGQSVTVTANVTDDETLASNLTYEWTASAGTISGAGNEVVWTAPTDQSMPAVHTISLSVIETYGSQQAPQQHRITDVSPAIYVDDSPRTIRSISEQFLRDFANSTVTPETCLQNFSDSCRGKASERNDIINNRRVYAIRASQFSNWRVRLNSTMSSGTVTVRCKFTSTIKATGATEVADGDCELRLIYENNRWWLCDSSYHSLNGMMFIF